MAFCQSCGTQIPSGSMCATSAVLSPSPGPMAALPQPGRLGETPACSPSRPSLNAHEAAPHLRPAFPPVQMAMALQVLADTGWAG